MQLVDHHVEKTRGVRPIEFFEGGEELVVAGRHGGRAQKPPHRKGVDELVIKLLVAQGIGNRDGIRLLTSFSLLNDVCGIDTEAALRRPGDEAFRVDGAGEMRMQVAALWHAMQKRAQSRVISARVFEAHGGDGRLEIAGEHGKPQRENERQ
jgi:hypothetical protein